MKLEKLTLPEKHKKLLFHICCAPCSAGIIKRLKASQIDFTLYFYNPNIHPLEEYEIRKNEIKKFATKENIPFLDADYEVEVWQKKVKGLENEPERGKRCATCFFLRLQKTAGFAKENNFDIFATSLSISRWKDIDQVHRAGQKAEKETGVKFWEENWRTGGGQDFGNQISKEEDFYRQTYCGCKYSMQNKTI